MRLFLVALFATSLAGCAHAHDVITIGGEVCRGVMLVEDPALEPICATAEEIALAILALTTPTARASGATLTTSAIRAEVLRQRAAKGTR